MAVEIQNLPVGYKQTEVGVIPIDWDVKKCAELGSFYKGKGISSRDLVHKGLPCIMYGDIYVKFDTKFTDPDFRISKKTAAKSTLAKTGDLLFTGSGETAEEIGKCVVYLGADDIYIGGDIIGLSPTADYDSLFLAYIQNSKMLLSQKANLGQGHTVVHIYTGNIKSLNLPLPPTKKEQSAIAATLYEIDLLIDKLEQQIEKKINIKQGTMQELLTGKRRLSEFKNKWVYNKLCDIAPLQRGFDLPTARLRSGPYPVVYSNGILNFHNMAKVKAPGVVTGRSGTIGKVSYIDKDFWPHNTTLWVTDFKGNDEKFIYYLYTYLKIEQFSTGSGVPTLNRNDVHAFEVSIPSLKDEQSAIASVLTDMDSEIEKLEYQLAKYRDIKQGMMQTLLTGKIRLV